MNDLVDPLGIGQVAQPDRAQVPQRNIAGQAVAHEVRNGLRQHDLAAVRGAHDPRRAVDRAAEIVVVTTLDDACVHPAAYAQRDAFGRGGVVENLLQLDRCAHRVERVLERRVQAVARHLDHRAAVALDRPAREGVVPGQRVGHPAGFLLPEAAAALDIGEEKGGDGRRVHARAPKSCSQAAHFTAVACG